VLQKFEEFLLKHGKKYGKHEKEERLKIFQQTLGFIKEHNTNPSKKHRVAMNRFGDVSDKEFREMMGMRGRGQSGFDGADYMHKPSLKELPVSFDWRSHGAVTPVKDQGVCGSCYAFASLGSIEGAYQIATQSLPRLSEQQIVDCAWLKNGDASILGCNGGFASLVFEWVKKNGGIATEDEYPYLMQNGF